MKTRRDFIRQATLAGAGIMALNPLMAAGAAGKDKLKNFGFISGIAKEAMEADWKGTLAKAVDFGFTELEGGSNYAASPKEFVSYCKKIGIKPVAGGIDFKATGDKLQKGFDQANELNQEFVVVYWPWLTGGPFTLDDCKKSSEMLNDLGAKAKSNGLKLLWHNHDKEFHAMEEGLPFDYLMNHTDPKLVQCEMDIYWVKKGGGDPLAVLKKYDGRIPILHVKDMAPDGDFICPGSGTIDFPTIFAEAKKQNIKHYMVERDNEPDGIGCLKSSGEYLSNLRF